MITATTNCSEHQNRWSFVSWVGQWFGRKVIQQGPEDIIKDLSTLFPRVLNELVLSYIPVDDMLREIWKKTTTKFYSLELPASTKAALAQIAYTVEELDFHNVDIPRIKDIDPLPPNVRRLILRGFD